MGDLKIVKRHAQVPIQVLNRYRPPPFLRNRLRGLSHNRRATHPPNKLAFGSLESSLSEKRTITNAMLEHVQFTGFSKSSGPTGE